MYKIQDYQVNPLSQYCGKIHSKGLYSDGIKMVLIYVIEQSSCLSPCTLKINPYGNCWNSQRGGNKEAADLQCEIKSQENMAIVFENNIATTHQVEIKHNNSETSQGTRKVLVFWILEKVSKTIGRKRSNRPLFYENYNSLDDGTGLNLRFDTHLIVNNWARKEFQKNCIVVIPRDLSLLITTYACGDLEYILNQRKEFRDKRSHNNDRVSRFRNFRFLRRSD